MPAVILYHQNNRVVEVRLGEEKIEFSPKKTIASIIFQIAEKYPDHLVIWCHKELKENLNKSNFSEIFHHNKIMVSYSLSISPFLSDIIGYVDESLFLNVKNEIKYPTWIMSSDVGGIHASVLKVLQNKIKKDSNFDYFLNSLAKLAMFQGLLCYSEPSLVKDFSQTFERSGTNLFWTFRFVKQHYKIQWIFLLFLNLGLYEKKVSILPLARSIFFRKRSLNENVLASIEIKSYKTVIDKKTVDVIIPTIGRKKYLLDILNDISEQTHLPKNVIIVEQNPEENSSSELDYLNTKNWPFLVKHIFTHQTGACNARNIALEKVESEWIFMADDDIRIQNDFLEQAFDLIKNEGFEQVTFGCYEEHYPESKKEKQKIQWDAFGSGCSIVKTKNVQKIFYNTGFEFGYGEDSDFGAQLRNSGFDILYSPKPEIIHLKAPIGGFRTKPVFAWSKDLVQPKPSPTVMLYKILNVSKKQLYGYKTVLFIKFYKVQKIKNPIKYYFNFQKQWESSLHWAEKLKQ